MLHQPNPTTFLPGLAQFATPAQFALAARLARFGTARPAKHGPSRPSRLTPPGMVCPTQHRPALPTSLPTAKN